MPLMNPLGAAITDSLGAFKEPLIRECEEKEKEREGVGGLFWGKVECGRVCSPLDPTRISHAARQ